MPKPKIDRVKLNQLLKAGKSQREVAQVFDVTEGAISKAKKELNLAVVQNVTMEAAHKVVDRNLDAVEQLQKINKAANQLLNELMGKEKVVQELATVINKINKGNSADVKGITKLVKQIISDKNTALKACQEIRGQLSLQLDIFKTLYDMEAVQEFQKEVLTVISEVSEDAKRKIIERLKARRAVRSTLQIT